MEQKDNSIKEVVTHLQTKFGKDEILIQDYWDADNCAIGLIDKTKQYLVYISTWKIESGKFYVTTEFNSTDDLLTEADEKEYKNVTAEELEQIVSSFFKIDNFEQTHT